VTPVLDTVTPVLDGVVPVLETVETFAPASERVDGPLPTVLSPVGQAPAPVIAAPVADVPELPVPAPTPPTIAVAPDKHAPAGDEPIVFASPADPAIATNAQLTTSASHTLAHTLRPDARTPHAPAPAPPTPTGAPGGGVSGSFSPPPPALFLALLTTLFCIPCMRYGRVVLAPARWRPVLFVSLLERPG
jgi:hypothetical protein